MNETIAQLVRQTPQANPESHPMQATLVKSSIASMLIALGLLLAGGLQAATYYWDGDGSGASGSPPSAGVGGSGTWDASSNLWWTGSAYTNWPNTSPSTHIADFRVAAGTVTIAEDTTIEVNTILLALNSFSFTGGNASSVLSFSGNDAKVTRSNGFNMGTSFSNLTVDTGSGVTFSEDGASTPFTLATSATLAGNGILALTSAIGNNYGATLNVHSTDNSGFAGGFAVLGGTRREALLNAPGANTLGTGPATVSGYGRIIYGWGAQAPVSGIAAGVAASAAGVIDLNGTWTSTADRFTLAQGGILRGSSAQLGSVTAVSAFSASPTGPELVSSPNSIIASTTNTTSATVANLPNDQSLYFGLGADFNNSAFAISVGDGTPWQGFANDGQIGGDNSRRRLQLGTVTISTGGTPTVLNFLTQGRQYGGYSAVNLWSSSFGYQQLVLGNGTSKPTFNVVGGGEVTARVMPGSELNLDAADVGGAFANYAVSYTGALISTRTNALNGKDVELAGGVLGVAPNRVGSPAGMTDAVGTLTAATGLNRLHVARRTAGTPDTLVINALERQNKAMIQVETSQALGTTAGDERLVLPASIVRGKIVDPYLYTSTNFLTLDGANQVVLPVYDATWGNGNILSTGTLDVASTVSADSLKLAGNLTGAGTINLGVLGDGSQASRAAIIGTVAGSQSIAPAIHAGISELIVIQDQGTTRSISLNGAVTAGSLTKAGNGILILTNAANSIGGQVSVWQGTLRINGGNGLNDGATLEIGPLGTFDLLAVAGNVETVAGLSGSGQMTVANGRTLAVANSADYTFNGAIGGAGALAKSGAGTLTLAGASTYAGGTSIVGGTLVAAHGSGLGNGTVQLNGGCLSIPAGVTITNPVVANSGVIGGGGTLAAAITVGPGVVISPGNSVDTLTTGAETWAGGGTYLWEINRDSVAGGTAGSSPGWDLLLVNGLLEITATNANPFVIQIVSLGLDNLPGLADFDLRSSQQFLIADSDEAILGFAADIFQIDAGGFANVAGSSWAIYLGSDPAIVGGDNTQLYLAFTKIPEPTSGILLALASLATRRRRKRA